MPVSAVSPRSHHYSTGFANNNGSTSPTAANNNNGVPPLTMPYVSKASPLTPTPYTFVPGTGSGQSRHNSYRDY